MHRQACLLILCWIQSACASGDPEPVWADESGAQLMYAYSRASETRQIVPVSSSSSSLQQSIDDTAAAAAIAAEHGGQTTSPEQDNGEGVDMLVRSTLRSASIGSLIGATSAAAVVAANANQQGATAHDSAAAADDESEGFAYNSGGAVVFTGGSYSLGPEQIGRWPCSGGGRTVHYSPETTVHARLRSKVRSPVDVKDIRHQQHGRHLVHMCDSCARRQDVAA